MSTSPIEIDEFTRRGHENFRRFTVLKCGDGKQRTFAEWLVWMKTWDPLTMPQDMRPPRKRTVAKKTAPNQ